jgi:hypothetical protein
MRCNVIGILYSPDPNPNEKCLQILDPADGGQSTSQETPNRWCHRSRSKTLTSYKETLENVDLDQPLHKVLRKFGKILPKCNREVGLQDMPSGLPGRNDGWIDLSLVCFHTFHSLHKVAAIDIEWTDCLAMHLEFDRRTKVLKLFRFPSLCFIMCHDPETSLMSK